MRTAFINSLVEAARERKNLFLIVGDLGYSVVEPFAREFPDRFLNAGIAEQNMTGIAAGLASEGFHVFTYSIANFPTLRCLEQIRNDICYHSLPVTIVSVGAGLAYGNLGFSHHAIQDMACLRGMPNCNVLSPADPGETVACLNHLIDTPGPSYLRLGKAGEPDIVAEPKCCVKPNRIFGECDASVAVVATGSILGEALKAAKELVSRIPIAVYSMPWLSPLEARDVSCLWEHDTILTLEEHVSAGGLGELLAAFRPAGNSLHSICLQRDVRTKVGSQNYLREIYGINSDALVQSILHLASHNAIGYRCGG